MSAPLRSLARTAAPGLLFFLVACRPSPVATVNGLPISKAELDAQLNVLRGGHPVDAAMRSQVLDEMIKRSLLEQAARRAGLDKDPGLRADIDARRGQARAQLEDAIAQAQARLQGIDATVEQDALVAAWSRRQRGGLTITAKDLQAAYDLRARRQPLPPFAAVRDQLLEQLIVDRLVERERPSADVRIGDVAAR